jgi:transcriptional regulator with XRE-family HTH domain
MSTETVRICAAIDAERRAAGLSQRELGERMGVSQAQASRWCTRQEPRLDQIVEIERHLGLPRGFLLRSAGYVEPERGVLDAIASDPVISTAARETLSAVYVSLAEGALGRKVGARPAPARSR